MFSILVLVTICVALCPCFILLNFAEATDQLLIENVITSYLDAEIDIWRLLKNEELTAVQKIHDVHDPIFKKSWGEELNIFFDESVFDFITASRETDKAVNRTIELYYRHHFEPETFSDQTAMLPFANYSANVAAADDFFNVTSQSKFWSSLADYFKECHHTDWEILQSSYQVLLDYYKEIQATLLKHYMTMQVSYMLLYFHQIDTADHLVRSKKYREKYLDRFSEMQSIARRYLEAASREVWACDPSEYHNLFDTPDYEDIYDRHNASSDQITGFLQSYVTNEANLNSGGSCTKTCEDYGNTTYYGNHQEDLPKCKGILRDCMSTFDNGLVYQFSSGNRKLSYIKDNDRPESSMGNEEFDNHQGNQRETKIQSWWSWFVKCSNCICTCDNPPTENSDRYFSLREAVSDISSNEIVTGVSFFKQNRMIRLIISERSLMPYLQVNRRTKKLFDFAVRKSGWRDLEREETWEVKQNEFKITDQGIIEGHDYHTLTYENRGIQLDTIMVPRGQLVTGVRLRIVKGRIRLEVRGTEFEYDTGLLKNIENSIWHWNLNGGKNKITLNNPASPLYKPTMSKMIQMENSFIEFGPSGHWADAGQTTVPFIDTQVVEPYNEVGLSGVGIYYKTQTGFGGFVGSKLIIHDYPPLTNGFIKTDSK